MDFSPSSLLVIYHFAFQLQDNPSLPAFLQILFHFLRLEVFLRGLLQGVGFAGTVKYIIIIGGLPLMRCQNSFTFVYRVSHKKYTNSVVSENVDVL